VATLGLLDLFCLGGILAPIALLFAVFISLFLLGVEL